MAAVSSTGAPRRRPGGLHVLMAALLVQGVSGLGGGLGLVADPSGRALDIPLAWLEGSPFKDYLIPGLVLLTLLGLGPVVVLYALRAGKRWARSAALVIGLALVGWIGVQVLLIGYRAWPPPPLPSLQVVYGSIGIVIAVSALLPSVRSHLAGSRTRTPRTSPDPTATTGTVEAADPLCGERSE